MANPVEVWKSEKHGFDVWPDVLRYAEASVAMKEIPTPDLERMKWHGVFYRKRDTPSSYMLRIRITAGEMTAEQAKEIAAIAYEYGYGIADITTRANIQVQGLAIENVPTAIERLKATGLTCKQTGHDNVRNVFGHPFSGLDPTEIIDTRDLCRRITDLFVDNRVYSDLPRKLNFALCGAEEASIHYWTQDLSFLARRDREGAPVFGVLIGGKQGGQHPHLAWPLPIVVRPEQVVPLTRSVLDLFRSQGSREKRDTARLRFLVERIGVPGVLDHLARTLDFPLEPAVTEPIPPSGYEDLVGWFRQKQPGKWIMGLCPPLGRLTWQQLEGLAIASKRWADGYLRTTVEQGIAVVNIPTGFKDAIATEVARHGLSVHADSIVRNLVSCTGKQFCNIAVTETKGHAYRLIDQLRQRELVLHGIRIHMSGCPSSCGNTMTADIGLKGVRVKRLLGTKEGFDVFLGGGVAGQVHLGIPYRLGVDVDQLPQLVDDVVREYYRGQRPGQTFSAYWREKLRHLEATAAAEAEYQSAIWECESCLYHHHGEDPPVYCPKCAALRRHFARLDKSSAAPAKAAEAGSPETTPEPTTGRSDGYAFAVKSADLADNAGVQVQIGEKTLAVFRHDGRIFALDNACPHEGAPLAEGSIIEGKVVCPWHDWSFDACTGCSIEPPDHKVASYATKIDGGDILVNVGMHQNGQAVQKAAPTTKAVTASLILKEIIDETPDIKTFRFDNSGRLIPPHKPGQFLRVGVPSDGAVVWRSFTICSAPTAPGHIDLTIKRNPSGVVSNYLHEQAKVGVPISLKGPQGAYYFCSESHREPLVLIAAGSGITPMMSTLRFLKDSGFDLPTTLIYGARTPGDVAFAAEIRSLEETLPNFRSCITLSKASPDWPGRTGRITIDLIKEMVPDLTAKRYFLCGPGDFMNNLVIALVELGVPKDRIHTEQF